MKKIGLLFTLFVLVSCSLYGQDRRAELMERVESRKVAFLSDKLELSSEEAQVFWPLHNEYQEALKEIRSSMDFRRDFMQDNFDHDEALDKLIKKEEEETAIRKKYAYKFKEAIGARKTIQFYHFERKFREEMIQELTSRRREGQGRHK